MENNQQSFWHFSDQLRVHTSNLANLSLNDSIWSNNSYMSKRPDERRNFDIKVGGEINTTLGGTGKAPVSDNYNDGWKQMMMSTNNNNNNNTTEGSLFSLPHNNILGVGGVGLNGGFNKGIYSKPSSYSYANLNLNNNNNNINFKGHKAGGEDNELLQFHPPKTSSKKNTNPNKKHGDNNNNNNNDSNKNNKDAKAAADKRFKTLPPESLPRNETIGGYIFVCNNDTMAENLKRQLFGMFPFLSISSLFLNFAVLTVFYDYEFWFRLGCCLVLYICSFISLSLFG